MRIPRKRFWFLLLIWIIVLFNVLYLVIMKLDIKDRFVQKYVINWFSEISGGEVEIGNLSFSDRFLLFENVSILLPERNISIEAESLHLEFRLSHLLWKHLRHKSLIEKAYINRPVIEYRYIKKKKKRKKTERGFPDLKRYLKYASIKDGRFDLTVDYGAYKHHEYFLNLDGSISTDDGVTGNIEGLTLNGGKASFKIDFSDGKLESIETVLRDYKPDMMKISYIDTLRAMYDIDFSLIPGEISFDAGLRDIHLEVANRKIISDSLDLAGSGDEMKFQFYKTFCDGNPVEFNGSLFDVYSSNIAVDAHLTTKNTDISDYQRYVKGYASGTAHMTGKIKDFLITATAEADSLFFENQKFENISLSSKITKNSVNFNINNLEWLSNIFMMDGFYDYEGRSIISAESDLVRYRINDIGLSGRLSTEFNYNTGNNTRVKIDNFGVELPGFEIDDLLVIIETDYENVVFNINSDYDDLSIYGNYSITDKDYSVILEMSRFKISEALEMFTLPNISGNIKCSGSQDSIKVDSNLRFYDQFFGNFGGGIKTLAELNLKNESSKLELHTSKAEYNYQSFKIDLIAEGNLDSIRTSLFKINNDIELEGSLYRNPVPGWKVKIAETAVDLEDVLKYFLDLETVDSFKGKIEVEADIDSRGEGNISADLAVMNLDINGLNPLNANVSIEGNNEKLSINSGTIKNEEKKLADLFGNLSLDKEDENTFSLAFYESNLNDILKEKDASGKFSGNLSFTNKQDKSSLNLRLNADEIIYKKLKIDTLSADITQQDSLLNIKYLHAIMPRNSILHVEGALGFNLFSQDSFNSQETMNISFNGDIINLLRQNIDYIKTGNSKCYFDAICSIKDDGLDISFANLELTGDDLRLKDQLEDIKDISIQCIVNENTLMIRDFSAKIGSGKFYLENSIGYNSEDLKINRLNIGQLLISTSMDGIRFHLPELTPKNAVTNVVLTGRSSHYFRFYNDNSRTLLSGDIIINQAEIVYPPGTDKLSNILNSFTTDITQRWFKQKEESSSKKIDREDTTEFFIPYDLDLRIVTGDNVRYVTYPFQVTFNPASYARIQKKEDKFTFQDADLQAEEGYVELVGTIMDVKNIQITYSELLKSVELNAVFSKKVADGTEILLLITDEGEGSFPNNLQMFLDSDNSYDLTDTEKLFRLRYGRGLDDISTEERDNLFQKDLIETAGGEIENIIIDPVINQFELFISRNLNIDYFQMETSFIYNLLSSNSDLYGETEDYERKYSADIFFENLSLKAGRYVLNDLLLNYDFTFQKIYDSDLENGLGIFHTISFRYDMPMDIKFLYEYNIDPWDRDSHSYSFERTIRFNNVNDLINKIFLIE